MRSTKLFVLYIFCVLGSILLVQGDDCTLPHSRKEHHTMSVCTMVNNEASYIQEWIEYHRLIKVDHFYIYDDRSTDNLKQVLQPYIDAGIVSLFHWDNNKTVAESLVDPLPVYTRNQRFCIADCIYNHQHETDWIAFWDIDEFLYVNPFFGDLKGVINKHLDALKADILQIPMTVFGPSHHTDRPSGLVLENYHWRLKKNLFGYDDDTSKFFGKTLFRSGCGRPVVHLIENEGIPDHCNSWREFVDIAQRPEYPAHFKHYYTKSWEDYSAKLTKWNWEANYTEFLQKTEIYNQVFDTDMDKYVPAIKQALDCVHAA